MKNPITTAEIEAGIPPQLQSTFKITAGNLDRRCQPVIEALWEAIRVFAPALRLGPFVHVILAQRPFAISLGNGLLSYNPKPEVINAAVENFLFMDVAEMLPLPHQIQVACMMEEFVHGLMHVQDERLTSVIVAHLYPGVVLVDGRYTVAPEADPSSGRAPISGA